ncbi:MAG: hypothetical protein ACI4OR_01475 [Alphaproteobacteria bacterium]
MLNKTLLKASASLDSDKEKKKKIAAIVKKMSDFFMAVEKEVTHEKRGAFYTREEYQEKVANQLGIPFDLKKAKEMPEEERLKYEAILLQQYKEKTGKNLIDLSFALTAEEILEQKIPKAVIGCTGTAKLFCHFAKQMGLDCSVVVTSAVKDLEKNKNLPPDKRDVINGHQIIGVQFKNGFYVFDPGALRVKDSQKSPTDLENLEIYPKYFKGPSQIGDVDQFFKMGPCQIRAIVRPEIFNQGKTYQEYNNLALSGSFKDSVFKEIPITKNATLLSPNLKKVFEI